MLCVSSKSANKKVQEEICKVVLDPNNMPMLMNTYLRDDKVSPLPQNTITH